MNVGLKPSTLSAEVIEALKGSKKPLLIEQISKKVTKTKYHCRIRKVLVELEKTKSIILKSDGWSIYKTPEEIRSKERSSKKNKSEKRSKDFSKRVT